MIVPVKDENKFIEASKRDFEFFSNHEAKYNEFSNLYYKTKDKMFYDFVGDNPLPTKQEKESEIKNRQKRVIRIKELEAPDIVYQNELELLAIVIKEYEAGKYIVTKEEKDYREQYDEKVSQFDTSPDWKDFCLDFDQKIENYLQEIGI